MSPSGSPRKKRTLGDKSGKDAKSPARKKPARSKTIRPDPPPEAPKSLVKLITSDREVLKYFRALQSNLDADVRIWKERAKSYQKESESLRRKIKRLEKQQKQANANLAKKSKAKKNPGSEENGNPQQKQSHSIDKQKQAQAKNPIDDNDDDDDGVPIQDFMFDLDSDCESHEKEHENRKSLLPSETNEQSEVHSNPQKNDGEALQQTINKFDSASDNGDDDSQAGESFLHSTNRNHSQLQQVNGADSSLTQEEMRRSPTSKITEQNLTEAFALETESSDDDSMESPLAQSMDLARSNHQRKHVQNSKELHYQSDYMMLRQAYLGLLQLGISLVEDTAADSSKRDDDGSIGSNDNRNTVDMSQTATGENDKEPITMKSHAELIPRRDDDVACSIAWAIHNMSRFQSSSRELLEDFPLFSAEDLSPVTIQKTTKSNDNQHPLVKGKELLFWSLMIMDTYCDQDMYSDSEWSDLFTSRLSVDESDDDTLLSNKIRIGMRGRKILVEDLLQSWSREMSDCWPVLDRNDFFTTANMRIELASSDSQDVLSDEYEFVDSQSSPALNSKIQGRLSGLVERCVVAQLVIGLYFSRNDHCSAADLVRRYLVNTAPGKEENHAQLSPVLSFVILESMLVPPMYSTRESNVLRPVQLKTLLGYDSEDKAFRSVDLCLSKTKDIWRQRAAGKTSNARIRDLAKVEVAAYERLVNSAAIEGEALVAPEATALEFLEKTSSPNTELAAFSAVLANIIDGVEFCKTQKILQPWSFLAQCQAVKGGLVRQLEAFKETIGKAHAMSVHFDSILRVESFSFIKSSVQKDTRLPMSLLQGAITLADGARASEYVDLIVESMKGTPDVDKDTAKLLSTVVRIPMVRVINLKDRPDRMRAFHCLAMLNDLIVVKAVATIAGTNETTPGSGDNKEEFFGQFAFDGRGRWESATRRLSSQVDNIEGYVAPFWRPNEMKAFDSNAPDDDREVTLTPSETACALSHIASWSGAFRTFRSFADESDNIFSVGGEMQSYSILKRLVRLSGFASGAPLLTVNKNLPPAPVIVILEDDAVLVERFQDRLEELLKELPRDFHYCSLGYSRPKTAPIVSFRDHVGIPTNLYYMTGYILSESGARYLLDRTPVVGPVDSWVGLKMTANFDNSFGTAVGVGHSQPNPIADPISQKDLSTFLKFRAFCAMQPLCMQRVVRGQTWRNRDTDIEFSGNAAPRQSIP